MAYENSAVVVSLEQMTRPTTGDDEVLAVMAIDNAALVPFVDSVLQQSGLEFFISDHRVQDLFGWGRIGTGFNPITGPPRVYVRGRDAEEAGSC